MAHPVVKPPSVAPDDCLPLREAVARGEVTMQARVRGQYPGTPLDPDSLPGLLTIGFWDAVGPQSWGLPMHYNEGIEICYLLSGETVFATARDTVLLRPGDITITRPWQRHRLGDPAIRPCRLFWVILDVESDADRGGWRFPDWIGPDARSRRELLRAFRLNQRCHLRTPDRSLVPILDQACGKFAKPDALSTCQLAVTVNHLILEVARILTEGVSGDVDDFHGFNQTVRGFFHGLEHSVDSAAESWSVEEIARACRVGTTYLNRACREVFNTTPADQLCRIRLSHAARLLIDQPVRTVTEIAFAVGFSSSQYFATCFRKHFGVNPAGFRKCHPPARETSSARSGIRAPIPWRDR